MLYFNYGVEGKENIIYIDRTYELEENGKVLSVEIYGKIKKDRDIVIKNKGEEILTYRGKRGYIIEQIDVSKFNISKMDNIKVEFK